MKKVLIILILSMTNICFAKNTFKRDPSSQAITNELVYEVINGPGKYRCNNISGSDLVDNVQAVRRVHTSMFIQYELIDKYNSVVAACSHFKLLNKPKK